MMKSLRQNKGITLIALVITIIVLLLLAGVAISMLTGENGIITKTNSAKTETEVAGEKESVNLAVLTALTVGNGEIVSTDAITALQNELEKAGCKNFAEINSLPATAEMPMGFYKIDEYGNVSETVAPPVIETDVSKLTTPVSEKTIYKDETSVNTTSKTVVIPTGFMVSTNTNEQKIDSGVVVKAPDGSEFVWVPVDDINSMVICQGSTGENNCNIIEKSGKIVCSTHGQPLCGRLYSKDDGANLDIDMRDHAYLVSGKQRNKEPYFATLESSLNQERLQALFDEMVKSVFENKGFFVGRFETTIESNIGVSKKNKYIARSSRWQAFFDAQAAYNQGLESIIGSSMIWGCQYDQMMIWMLKNGIDVNSTTPISGASKNVEWTTGYKEADKLNNVYDLLGCGFEWTMESKYENPNTNKVMRGMKDSGGFGAPSSRQSGFRANTSNTGDYSSRMSLYVK